MSNSNKLHFFCHYVRVKKKNLSPPPLHPRHLNVIVCLGLGILLKWVPFLWEHDTRGAAQVMEKEKTRQAITLH